MAVKKVAKKNPAKVAAGKQGGLVGGPARAKKLTHQKKHNIAKKAADTRWGHRKPKP